MISGWVRVLTLWALVVLGVIVSVGCLLLVWLFACFVEFALTFGLFSI